ncbi:Trp biosynthesis-associated membrane protein [Compostimonas suwonensis]|uniref:Putative membrane protein (TIGR02234 family) n=1 Tax=Compostimonas suwonensis TaxID=1048394 RepID=A0A2M9BYJ7_9MICO|nr:Trp biosynthesis-associated membrane protein [Compostimonas suwonensis]PJJ63152.1 putative membrane protein (TIGR02234 family) [Compostimonas suwonensis]
MTTSQQAKRGSARVKYLILLLVAVSSGIGLLAWSQPWSTLTLLTGATIPVDGSVAAPALSALSLAGLALAAALAIAGPVFRIVLGILDILLGGCVLLSASLALADPVAAGASAVTTTTGVAGSDSVSALVDSWSSTAWGAVAVAGGILTVVGGLAVCVTSRRWPASSRRYQPVVLVPADGSAALATEETEADRNVDAWDELSRGDDPTRPA